MNAMQQYFHENLSPLFLSNKLSPLTHQLDGLMVYKGIFTLGYYVQRSILCIKTTII